MTQLLQSMQGFFMTMPSTGCSSSSPNYNVPIWLNVLLLGMLKTALVACVTDSDSHSLPGPAPVDSPLHIEHMWHHCHSEQALHFFQECKTTLIGWGGEKRQVMSQPTLIQSGELHCCWHSQAHKQIGLLLYSLSLVTGTVFSRSSINYKEHGRGN